MLQYFILYMAYSMNIDDSYADCMSPSDWIVSNTSDTEMVFLHYAVSCVPLGDAYAWRLWGRHHICGVSVLLGKQNKHLLVLHEYFLLK